MGVTVRSALPTKPKPQQTSMRATTETKDTTMGTVTKAPMAGGAADSRKIWKGSNRRNTSRKNNSLARVVATARTNKRTKKF